MKDASRSGSARLLSSVLRVCRSARRAAQAACAQPEQAAGEVSSPTRNPARRQQEEAYMTWTEITLTLSALAQMIVAFVAVVGMIAGREP